MGKRILMIEDDEDIRLPLKMLLAIEDYEIETAENGQVGINYLRDAETLPDLILLDLVMPVMDGYAFSREKLADPRLAKIPVILMSANWTADRPPLSATRF